jgi:XRE family aerobic/anaerobic benzoate catabolism transcriptional regulator
VAEALSVDFVELDARIEALAGLSLAEIFAIHGEPYYRRIEFEALTALVADGREAVVATGGSVVAHDESWQVLRDQSQTLWLRADAQDHWDRVIAQGDHRPMDRNPHAFAQLEALLKSREPLYAQAERVVDTSRKSLDIVVAEVISALQRA